MQEDAKKENTILLEAKVHPWMDIVTQLSTHNEIRGGRRQRLHGDHYSKNLLKNLNQLLGTIGCFVQFWDRGKLYTIEEHVSIEGRNVPCYKKMGRLIASIIYDIQTADLLREVMTGSKLWFV